MRTPPPGVGGGVLVAEGVSAGVVAAVVVVEVAAAGLGQATADHVADRQQRDVEPTLLGAEVGGVNDGRRNQDTDDRGNIGDQLGGLERGLRLGAEAALDRDPAVGGL